MRIQIKGSQIRVAGAQHGGETGRFHFATTPFARLFKVPVIAHDLQCPFAIDFLFQPPQGLFDWFAFFQFNFGQLNSHPLRRPWHEWPLRPADTLQSSPRGYFRMGQLSTGKNAQSGGGDVSQKTDSNHMKATGKSPEPAGWKACATQRRHSCLRVLGTFQPPVQRWPQAIVLPGLTVCFPAFVMRDAIKPAGEALQDAFAGDAGTDNHHGAGGAIDDFSCDIAQDVSAQARAALR